MKLLRTLALATLASTAACLLTAAETVHLFLRANGVDIQGEPTRVSLGRENSIECVAFSHEVYPEQDRTTGLPTGRRKYEPIRIVKRIDKSSPLLMKALCNNEVIEGTFRFYRANPSGDGTTQQHYTIRVTGGRIVGARTWCPNVLDPASSDRPELEEISFVFNTITWTYTNGGIEHQDSVN
jgi:type VI secretion system secreted protein Hcp